MNLTEHKKRRMPRVKGGMVAKPSSQPLPVRSARAKRRTSLRGRSYGLWSVNVRHQVSLWEDSSDNQQQMPAQLVRLSSSETAEELQMQTETQTAQEDH